MLAVTLNFSAAPGLPRSGHRAAERFLRTGFMATLTASMVLMRWQLLGAVLMFLASTLNIQFRKSDYQALAVISSGLGIAASCVFATGLLGVSIDFHAIWHNMKDVMVEVMSHTPPEWPMVVT
ncbi:hypothetical protein ESA_00111 [Cronobacter sakazakii ATCC BAA-894]|uniref:Uncharacterized protein n=3 Tax=Cronobacter TaxID=413496 RepID=A7MPL9_CROS8|nr:hypothetical protein ESA_00111 [Cronobacter sakazakii ATCC BAA-894]